MYKFANISWLFIASKNINNYLYYNYIIIANKSDNLIHQTQIGFRNYIDSQNDVKVNS